MPSQSREWAGYVPKVSAIVRDHLARNKTVVLDFSFDIDGVWPAIDRFAAGLLDAAAPHVHANHKVVILLDRDTHERDDLRESASRNPWRNNLIIANTTTGEFTPNDVAWAEANLAEIFRTNIADVRDAFAERIVRRRGVFEEEGEGSPTQFRFSSENAADHLQLLLEHYFESESIKVVVYDDRAEPWFQETIRASAVAAAKRRTGNAEEIPVYSSARVKAAAEKRGRAARTDAVRSSIAQNKTAAVLPMIKSGERAASIRRDIQTLGGEAAILASMVREVKPGGVFSGFLRDHRAIGGDVAQTDYFVGVKHRARRADEEWIYQAADALGQVEDPLVDWAAPTRVAMWSLFAKIGTEVEFPPPRARPRIRHFPALRNVDELDALWLAECLVRTAERVAGSHLGVKQIPRSRLFFVIPAERSGSEHIANILKDVLEVAVVQIPRTVIEGTSNDLPSDLHEIVLQNVDRSIVLLDESAVTFRTLNRMSEIVKSISGAPQLSLAVVESDNSLWSGARPANLHSFYRLARHASLVEPESA